MAKQTQKDLKDLKKVYEEYTKKIEQVNNLKDYYDELDKIGKIVLNDKNCEYVIKLVVSVKYNKEDNSELSAQDVLKEMGKIDNAEEFHKIMDKINKKLSTDNTTGNTEFLHVDLSKIDDSVFLGILSHMIDRIKKEYFKSIESLNQK